MKHLGSPVSPSLCISMQENSKGRVLGYLKLNEIQSVTCGDQRETEIDCGLCFYFQLAALPVFTKLVFIIRTFPNVYENTIVFTHSTKSITIMFYNVFRTLRIEIYSNVDKMLLKVLLQ